MSKKSFSAAAEAAVQALLNAQKVDASIITDECGNVAIRKAPWNDAETICEVPKVIPGRMICSGGEMATSSTSNLTLSRAGSFIRRLSIPRMAPSVPRRSVYSFPSLFRRR